VIAISVGYRLGTYSHFVDDAAMAVGWVRENIAELGGDVNNVYLSGHSAGAHIASLMTVRHERFLKPHNVPPSFIKGLMLISGGEAKRRRQERGWEERSDDHIEFSEFQVVCSLLTPFSRHFAHCSL